jgi:16S rRNA (uracil1498-N3)-methyltransferase
MALHFLVDDVAAGDSITLTGAEAHHAAVVRRVRVGEEVTVGDGRGVWLVGQVEDVAPKRVTVQVTPARDRGRLASSSSKPSRRAIDELAVQAATELGVDEVVPWQAARSVSRWTGDKIAKGLARWSTIVREAAKQAHRAVPPVTAPVTTAQLAARGGARLLVLEPTASSRCHESWWMPTTPANSSSSSVLEASPDELDALAASGA